jgi:hypothetical protein
MSVVSWKTLSLYSDALKALAENFYIRTALRLTGEEFVSAFINPDHIDKLREVQALVGYVGTSTINSSLITTDGHSLAVHMAFVGSSPVSLPRYVSYGIQKSCPEPVKEKLTGWTDERVRIGTAIGDVLDAITHLNDQCGDLRAMSIMLPCLPTIMAQVSDDADNKTVKRARKLAGQKAFGSLPKLPMATKQRLLEASALVNAMTLTLDAPAAEMSRGDASVTGVSLVNGRQDGLFSSVGSFA